MRAWIQPDPHRERLAGCYGKIPFSGPARADKAIKQMLRRDRKQHDRGEHLSRYRCRYCGAWHIGNTA